MSKQAIFLSPTDLVVDDSSGQLVRRSAPQRAAPKPRRTALNEAIDDYAGKGADECVRFLVGVMRGEISIPARRAGPGEDAASVALIPQVFPTIAERADAAKFLINHRHGKPGQRVEVAATVQTAPVDLGVLSEDEFADLEKLVQKAAAAPVVRADVVDVDPDPIT